MSQFENKVVLVTGGTNGMGLNTARMLAQAGAKVVICGRKADAGETAVAMLREQGFTVRFIRCDVTQESQVAEMIDAIVSEYGRLDCAFNNAGLTAEHARLGDTSPQKWKEVIDVNLHGTYFCMRHQLRAMAASGGGAIVNNSSLAGVMAIPGQASYVASKFAVIGLTQAAAIEYAVLPESKSGIRVNAIAAGPIMGGMNDAASLDAHPERTQRKIAATAMRRFGKADEVAQTVLWLLSDAASYITGAVIPVDGGAGAGKF